MTNRRERPDAEAILRRIPRDEGDLFRGASAWAQDLSGWRRSVREELREAPDRRLRRTVWDDPRNGSARILVDVVECASAAAAVQALLDRLEWNQLAELPAGPEGLGLASFAHPEAAPPAVFFARANLCVNVASFARHAAAVVPVALAIDRRLLATPASGGPSIGVEMGGPRATGGPAELRVTLPFRLGEEGHLRFRARGGTLEIRADQVVVVPAAGAEVQVEVFAEEPGRPAGTGRMILPR